MQAEVVMGKWADAVSRGAVDPASMSSVVQLQRRAERALLWLRPDGWQGRARRNAWSAMVADNQRRQDRMFVASEIGPSVSAVPPVPAARVPRPARHAGETHAARAR
jgi:hypothetical protein